jgi:hypothetical protein
MFPVFCGQSVCTQCKDMTLAHFNFTYVENVNFKKTMVAAAARNAQIEADKADKAGKVVKAEKPHKQRGGAAKKPEPAPQPLMARYYPEDDVIISEVTDETMELLTNQERDIRASDILVDMMQKH